MRSYALVVFTILAAVFLAQAGNVVQAQASDNNVKTAIEQARRGKYKDALKSLQKNLSGSRIDDEARFVLSKIYLETGEYKQAEDLLEYFKKNSKESLLQVQGAWLYAGRIGDKELAKKIVAEYLPGIEKDSPEDALKEQLYVFWGNCYLEKGDLPNAEVCFNDALKVIPFSVDARLGLARKQLSGNAERAIDLISEIISLISPDSETISYSINSPYAEAQNLLAGAYLAVGQFPAALEAVDRAIRVNPDSIAYHATKATIYYLSGDFDKFEKESKTVLKANPQPALFYFIIGKHCEKRLFYNDATGFLEKAVALDKHLWEAQTVLGMNYMHLGPEYERKGRKLLEDAFERDPFDVYAYNMLKVLDALNDEFDTVKTEHFEIKLHKDERFLLEPYITELLEDAYNKFIELYQFKPSLPLLVEVFPNHNDFSVRLMGMPGFHAARGVCFVKTFLVLSPKAQEQMAERFHWGSITIHEFMHIYTLQMSNFRVPRWFTEGCSEYAEKIYNPIWGRGSEYEIAQAMSEGKLQHMDTFMNRRGADVLHSYVLSSIIIEYIHKKYGMDKIIKMLNAWQDYKDSETVFKECLGKGVAEFDKEFFKYLREEFFKGVNYKEFETVYKNAKELLKQHEEEKAIAEFIKAKELFPRYTKPGDNPYYYLATLHEEYGNKELSVKYLEAMIRMNQNDFANRMKLAKLYRAQKQYNKLAGILKETVYLEPENIQLHNYLGEAFYHLKEYQNALRENGIAIKLLLRLPAGEKRNFVISDFYCSSADIYLQLNNRSKAREALDKAREFFPDNKRIKELMDK